MRVYDRLGLRRTRDLAARLEHHSAPSGTCRVWLGSLTHDGYGRISIHGRDRLAHVVAYEHHVGPVATGLVLDHKCRNRACINAEHLEPVSQRENSLRGEHPTFKTVRTKVCRRGHEIPSGTRCLNCRNAAQRAWYERKLAKTHGAQALDGTTGGSR